MKIRTICPSCSSTRLLDQPAVLMPFVANRVFGWESVQIDSSWNLRDIPNGVLTFGCKTLHCSDCHTTFLDIGFDEDEMNSLYSGYRSDEYNKNRIRYEPSYLLRADGLSMGYEYLDEVESLISEFTSSPIKDVFDWGGDTGLNTPFKDSAEVTIYDPSGQAVVNNNINSVDNLEKISSLEFDLFVSMNVLEHLPYPQHTLRSTISQINSKLFYFEVPCEQFVTNYQDSIQDFWKSKRHWHEHVNCFTPESFEILIKNSGLHTMYCKKHIFNNNGRRESIISCIASRY